MPLSNAEIQQRGRCNWCLNPLYMSDETWGDECFIDTGKHFTNNDIAYAVYCTDCCYRTEPNRLAEPKSAINKDTLDEINVEDLPS